MDLTENINYRRALEYIARTDLSQLEPGRHELDGANLFVNIVDADLKTPDQARLEVHDAYIDIQVPLSCPESFGVKPCNLCTMPDGVMDPSRDIMFFDDRDWATVTVDRGQPITFDPDTAHAPLIGEGRTHKAIFKVKVI